MGFLNEKRFNVAMLIAVLLILVIPVGLANFYLGYYLGESPCTLCWFERFCMISVGFLGLFMVVYGPKLKYIFSVFFIGAFGIYMALRHFFLWVPGDIGSGQAGAMFGGHTYTWGIFVYWAVVIVMAFLLLFIDKKSPLMDDLSEKRSVIKPFTVFGKVVVALTFIVTFSNGIQALFTTGLPPNSGKHFPDRWTMDLTYANERMQAGVWKRLQAKWSFAGNNVVTDPLLPGVSEPKELTFEKDPAKGAFKEMAGDVKLLSKKDLPFKADGIYGEGNAAGISYSAKNKEFGVCNNRGGMYFVDDSLSKVTGRAVIDVSNGHDTHWTADCSFVGDKLLITAWNKMLLGIEHAAPAKTQMEKYKEWSTLRETTGNMKTSWFWDYPFIVTDRARLAYVTNMAGTAKQDGYYMISVPNKVAKRPVFLKVDAADRKLTEEAYLKADAKLLKDKRNINDYYVTGLVTAPNGQLLAYSIQYNTLLVINPDTKTVVGAYRMPSGLNLGHSLTIKGSTLMMLGRENGKDVVYEMELPTLG
jgi:disulfide bond formation protein DsbB